MIPFFIIIAVIILGCYTIHYRNHHAPEKTKVCRFCKTEINAKAVACPNCGRSQTAFGTKVLTLIIVIVAFIALLIFISK